LGRYGEGDRGLSNNKGHNRVKDIAERLEDLEEWEEDYWSEITSHEWESHDWEKVYESKRYDTSYFICKRCRLPAEGTFEPFDPYSDRLCYFIEKEGGYREVRKERAEFETISDIRLINTHSWEKVFTRWDGTWLFICSECKLGGEGNSGGVRYMEEELGCDEVIIKDIIE
jgi:hypothetical protein